MRSHTGLHTGVVGVVATLALCLSGAAANAQSVTTERQTVNPQAAPAPSGATVVQQPQPSVQVQQAPAPAPAPSSTSSKQVVTETHSENFMGTIAKNTLFGAVAGTLVGGAIYFINRDDIEPRSIAYWASGGALVGAAVGVVELTMREDRNERAVSQILNGGKTNVAFVGRVVDVKF
jgi:hypothetical protein